MGEYSTEYVFGKKNHLAPKKKIKCCLQSVFLSSPILIEGRERVELASSRLLPRIWDKRNRLKPYFTAEHDFSSEILHHPSQDNPRLQCTSLVHHSL
jgi:hypothetical protein